MRSEDFKDILAEIMQGKIDLPNAVELEAGTALNRIASGGGASMTEAVHWAKTDGRKNWARYLIHYTQGGQLAGTGIAVVRQHKAGKAYTFAICEHEKIMGQGANPNRGWHPGRCSKCGLDMTVDSGD